MGDSSNSDEIIPLCGDGLDVLVHEATVEDALKDKAVENGHSTPSMAVELALKVRARKLVIFHLSPRYKPVGSETKEDEVTAQVIFDEAVAKVKREKADMEVVVAEDFTEVEIGKRDSIK